MHDESVQNKEVPLKTIFIRASLMWIAFCGLAFFNGALREVLLKNTLGILKPKANQLSCVTGIIFWTAFAYWRWPGLEIKSWGQAICVGLGWFFATLVFETFIIDRKLDWSQIVATYDVSNGQYWAFVLLWIGLLPIVLFSVSRFRRH